MMKDKGEYTPKDLRAIARLRKELSKAGMLNDDGEYYLGDDEYISVETVYDLGLW